MEVGLPPSRAGPGSSSVAVVAYASHFVIGFSVFDHNSDCISWPPKIRLRLCYRGQLNDDMPT